MSAVLGGGLFDRSIGPQLSPGDDLISGVSNGEAILDVPGLSKIVPSRFLTFARLRANLKAE